MSARSLSSTLLLLGVCCSVSSVYQADVTLNLADNTKITNFPETQTRLLTIKTIVSTIVSTVSHTVMVYPTCTTTAQGVSVCAGGDPLPPRLASITVPATMTPHVPGGMRNTPSTTANLMEVILPSCDCGNDTKGNRTPRFLRSEDVITLQTTTTLTLDKVISATAPTTVSITYNGCVPLDAISTAPCLTSTTSTTTSTSS